MPKQKTKKVVAKRFKVTKSGKVLRGRQNSRHLRSNKTKRQIRRFKEPKQLTTKQARWVKALLNN